MSDTAIAPVPINWEAVRALAMVVGVREAARRMELSEDRVRQRSHREGWLASDSAKRAVQIANANRIAEKSVTTLSPAALIHSEIASLGSKTRLSLARGVAKASEHVENMQGSDILADAQNIKSVAQTADLVHGWKDAAPQVKIRLDVLSGSADAQPIDIEATEIPSASASWVEDSVDPLDEY
jgi:hypothetical protein